jgi:hypothetical protein
MEFCDIDIDHKAARVIDILARKITQNSGNKLSRTFDRYAVALLVERHGAIFISTFEQGEIATKQSAHSRTIVEMAAGKALRILGVMKFIVAT